MLAWRVGVDDEIFMFIMLKHCSYYLSRMLVSFIHRVFPSNVLVGKLVAESVTSRQK